MSRWGWGRIVAPGIPRVATTKAAHRQPDPPPNPHGSDSLNTVFRAAWVESTGRGEERPQPDLVGPDTTNRQAGDNTTRHPPFSGLAAQPVHRARARSAPPSTDRTTAERASSMSLARSANEQVSNRARPMKTTANPDTSGFASRRNASRNRRLARFRSTDPPSFRPTANPA